MCVCVCNSQGFDGTQRSEQAFADGLKFVVIERQQVEVLQIFKSVHSKAVDLVGVQQSRRVNKSFIRMTFFHQYTQSKSEFAIWKKYYSGLCSNIYS